MCIQPWFYQFFCMELQNHGPYPETNCLGCVVPLRLSLSHRGLLVMVMVMMSKLAVRCPLASALLY